MADEKFQSASVEQWRELFDSNDAEAADRPAESVSTSLTGDQEIHRMWRVSVGEEGNCTIDRYIQLFNLYTDSKNKDPQQYIDDPLVNKTVIAGRYRLAFVRAYPLRAGTGKENGTNWKIVQTLRKGFIQTLKGPDWSEARQVQVLNVSAGTGTVPVPEYLVEANQEDYVIAEWPNCDARCSELFRTQLNQDDEFENVVVGGIARPGKWWRTTLVIDTDKQDGSAKVTLTLARPQYVVKEYENYGTPNEAEVWKYTGVPKPLVVQILAAHKIEGADASTRYGSGSGLVEITIRHGSATTYIISVQTAANCDYNEWTALYYGYDLAQAEALINNVLGSPRDAGVTHTASVPSLMANGKYSFEIGTRTSIESSQRFVIHTDSDEEGYSEEHVYAHNRRIPGFNNETDPFDIPQSTFMALHSSQTIKTKYTFKLEPFQKNGDCTFSWHSVVSGPEGLGDDVINWKVPVDAVYRSSNGMASGTLQVSYHVYIHTIQDYRDEGDAYASINEDVGSHGSLGKYLPGTTVCPVRGGVYRAERITDGGWTTWIETGRDY